MLISWSPAAAPVVGRRGEVVEHGEARSGRRLGHGRRYSGLLLLLAGCSGKLDLRARGESSEEDVVGPC